MGSKQLGAGKFVPYNKHLRNNKAASWWNKAIRRRIKQAIKKSPDEPMLGLRHF